MALPSVEANSDNDLGHRSTRPSSRQPSSAGPLPSRAGLKQPCSDDASGWPAILDLERQFAFYGQYHSNRINILTHVLCVPMIFFSSLVLSHGSFGFKSTELSFLNFKLPHLLVWTGFYGSTPQQTVFEFNLATITSIGYSLYFALLEPISGSALGLVLISCGHWSNLVYQSDPSGSIKAAWWIFFLAWIAQFVGHGKFEKRAPALVDNLFQSVVLALLFVWLEVWFYFGYRKDLRRRLELKIDRAIQEYRNSKASPSSQSGR